MHWVRLTIEFRVESLMVHVGHGDEMIGIATTSVFTGMVNLQLFCQRRNENGIGQPMYLRRPAREDSLLERTRHPESKESIPDIRSAWFFVLVDR